MPVHRLIRPKGALFFGICWCSFTFSLHTGRKSGQTCHCHAGNCNAPDVLAYNLKLDYSKGNVLSTQGDFQRNADYFPALCLGGQEVNLIKRTTVDSYSYIGLMTRLGSYTSRIGRLTFDIPASALTDSAHELTLSGEIYTSSGNVGSLSPVTRTFKVVPFTDTDGDGMDDSWEQYYFGSLVRTGLEDYDYDGVSDADEYLNGTSPTDNIKKGDANRDSETDLKDVITVLQICAD